jgi:hypothetical protein
MVFANGRLVLRNDEPPIYTNGASILTGKTASVCRAAILLRLFPKGWFVLYFFFAAPPRKRSTVDIHFGIALEEK